MNRPRVYLAGPDVFLPEPEAWAAEKAAICRRHGLVGVSPLDPLPNEPAAWGAHPDWHRIALRNEAHIRSCAAVIANLTPFRGPSADPGTVYEVGFARGIGLPVFGYACVDTGFLDRTRAVIAACQEPGGAWRDSDGLLIEHFGLFDNLMIEGGIATGGGTLLTGESADTWRDLTIFERCVQVASAGLGSQLAAV